MTPEEKARELYNSHLEVIADCAMSEYEGLLEPTEHEVAKSCALITVDEILITFEDNPYITFHQAKFIYRYWESVKQELEKM